MLDDASFEEEVCEPPQKKVKVESKECKSAPFSIRENTLLAELYSTVAREYHAPFTSASKNGQSVQEKYACKWAESISSLGDGQRTAKDVKQRILGMRKVAGARLNKELASLNKTGGGRSKLPEPEQWLKLVCEVVSVEGTRKGIVGAIETGGNRAYAQSDGLDDTEHVSEDFVLPVTCSQAGQKTFHRKEAETLKERIDKHLPKTPTTTPRGKSIDPLTAKRIELIEAEIALARSRQDNEKEIHQAQMHRIQLDIDYAIKRRELVDLQLSDAHLKSGYEVVTESIDFD